MGLFVSYGDMQGNTDNRQNVALYMRIEKKEFISSSKSKCRSTCGAVEMLLRIYFNTNQTQTRIMIMIVIWRKLNIIHQVNYLLRAKIHIQHYNHILH